MAVLTASKDASALEAIAWALHTPTGFAFVGFATSSAQGLNLVGTRTQPLDRKKHKSK